MSKKTIFIGIVSLSILCFSTVILADQYFDQYPGVGFVPDQETADYEKYALDGAFHHNDTDDMYYYCPVNFNVPDGSTYFIKSIGMRYKDNLTNGYIIVQLRRENLYTGAEHTVAEWTSGESAASSDYQTASKGTNAGYKLVDTRKFSYWLYVYFYVDGSINPSTALALIQVRVHYGT